MSKKILSLVLAVVLVASTFACMAFAAPAAGNVGIKLTTDAVVGAAVDSIVTVKVYLTLPDSDYTARNQGIGKETIAFDGEYFEYVADSQVFGSDYSSFLKPGTPTNPATAALKQWNETDVANFGKKSPNASNASYKDTASTMTGVTFQVAYDGGQTTYTATTGYPLIDAASSSELYSFKLKVKKVLTADTKIGVINGSLTKQTVEGYYASGKTTQTKYTAAQFDLSEALVAPKSAAKPIVFDKTQAQWANGKNEVQDTWKLGIVGKFKTSDIAIAFDDKGTSTNVTEVGVDVTAGDYTTTETTRFVYETATGEYSYRAVVTNIPADVAADKEITVTFFAMVKPSAEEAAVKVVGETKTINLAEVLATAQANGMAK